MWAYLLNSLAWSTLGLLAGAAVTDAGWTVRHNLDRSPHDDT